MRECCDNRRDPRLLDWDAEDADAARRSRSTPIVSALAVSVRLLAGSVVAPLVMALAFVLAAATLGDVSLAQFEPRVRA